MMNNKTISVIGAGHLGAALARGLLKSGQPASSILFSNRDPKKLSRLAKALQVRAAESNIKATQEADILVLGVKPQFMQDVCLEIAVTVQKKRPLIISLAAVTDLANIALWLGVSDLGIVRVMTNTPMEFCKGMSALFANIHVTPEQSQLCEAIFKAVGSTFWTDKENLLDPLTAAIGSAPAYVLLFMEALQQAAMSQGIPDKLAEKIALEVFSGTAELAKQSGRSFVELRAGVTTPHGITERSLQEISERDLFDSFKQVYKAANKRIDEIKQG